MVQALFRPRLLPAWVPPHPASGLQLRARGAGGCGRAGCGHRPDRAEAPARWVRPWECSARTAVVERMIPAQGPDGLRILSQWFFRDWTWPREGDQQQERALSVAAQPAPPGPYHYSWRTNPIGRRGDGAVGGSCQRSQGALKVKLEEGGQCCRGGRQSVRDGLQKPAFSYLCTLALP